MSNSRDIAAQLNEVATKLGMTVVEGGGNGWAAAPKASSLPFIGVSIPIKVSTPSGSVRCYLSLPPEVASTPEGLLNAIKALVDMGIPVDAYQKQENGGWNGGGSNGGGWNGGGRSNGYGGGYRRY